MALQQFNGKQIRNNVLTNDHVAANAAIAESKLNIDWAARYTACLQSKKVVDYVQMNNIAVVAETGSVDILKGEGAGKISQDYATLATDYGVTALYPVIMRERVTGNPIYVNNKEVYGKVSFANDTYTIAFHTGDFASSTAVDMPVGITAVDLQYACRFDLSNVPENFAANEKFVDGAVDVTEINNLKQLAKDLYGSSWSLDNDAVANLSTSIKDEIVRIDADASTTGSIKNLIKTEAMDVLASTDTNKGASLIGVKDASDLFTATNVEGVLTELHTDITDFISKLASTDADKGASQIGVQDAGGIFTATTVEGVLVELEGRINSLEDNGGAEVTATHTRETASANGYFAQKIDAGSFTSLEDRLIDIETVIDTAAKGLADEISRATGVEGNLQTEIDNIETATGLKTDGTKDDFTSVVYILAADSHQTAINKLDAALDGVDGRLETAEGFISTNGPKIHVHSEESYIVPGDVPENTTEYTLVDTNVKSTDFIAVYFNGARQVPTTHFTKTIVDGKITKITLGESFLPSDVIHIEIIKYI